MCGSEPSWEQVTWFSPYSDNTEEGGREGEGEGERASEGEGLEGEGGSEAEREDIKAAFQSVIQAQSTASTRGNFPDTSLTPLYFSSSATVYSSSPKEEVRCKY